VFYEETVLNGILHWRGTPTGEWLPMNAETLTSMLLESREHFKNLNKVIDRVTSSEQESRDEDQY
jgi:hypothetical protein